MIRILLADDYTIIRKGVQQILTQAFPHALFDEIKEGEDWTEQLQNGNWDLVICDLPVRNADGWESLRQIRRRFPEMEVLILTFYSKANYATRAINAGATGYIEKSTPPAELIMEVARILSVKKDAPLPG